MDRSVVFLDLKGGCAPCDKPLMLRPILFCPVLTWVAQELTACGAQRFFIVCDEAWQDEVRDAEGPAGERHPSDGLPGGGLRHPQFVAGAGAAAGIPPGGG